MLYALSTLFLQSVQNLPRKKKKEQFKQENRETTQQTIKYCYGKQRLKLKCGNQPPEGEVVEGWRSYLCFRKYVSRVSRRQALSMRTTSSLHSWDMSSHTSIQLPLWSHPGSSWGRLSPRTWHLNIQYTAHSARKKFKGGETIKQTQIRLHNHNLKYSVTGVKANWESPSGGTHCAAYLLGNWNGPKWNPMLHLLSVLAPPLSFSKPTAFTEHPSLQMHKDIPLHTLHHSTFFCKKHLWKRQRRTSFPFRSREQNQLALHFSTWEKSCSCECIMENRIKRTHPKGLGLCVSKECNWQRLFFLLFGMASIIPFNFDLWNMQQYRISH